MAKSSGKRQTTIGVLFWIALILLILVVFLANRSNIEHVMESTGLIETIRDRFGSGGETEAVDQPVREPGPTVVFDPPARDPAPSGDPLPVAPPRQEPSPPQQPAAPAAPAPPAETPRQPAPSPAPQRAPSPDPERPNRLMANLYFIKLTDSGRIHPQRVVRPVYYATGPLTETIRSLIAGPSASELDNGLINLIPPGTELISASVQGGVAYLNFNQSFRFNSYGAEGTVAQLLQIIYSSTEFPTVDRVQFMVDGEVVDYLGGDGIFVGEPLDRTAFS
ncbi:MAG: hypothetical protein EA382_03095 [Spirochaetaceae bacterium]|nr:MAG: hypothetical protein EA382_03095 [Spirochaetaceae bacterium]